MTLLCASVSIRSPPGGSYSSLAVKADSKSSRVKTGQFCRILAVLSSIFSGATRSLSKMEPCSETLRVLYVEDGMRRRKSAPIACRATSGRLA